MCAHVYMCVRVQFCFLKSYKNSSKVFFFLRCKSVRMERAGEGEKSNKTLEVGTYTDE